VDEQIEVLRAQQTHIRQKLAAYRKMLPLDTEAQA
jgi:hypothetical protein